jgi:parallel beta-helix repeat protein
MYNTSGSPTVSNCTFSGNSGSVGAGMCNLVSSPTVSNCTFTGNSAGLGAGMSNRFSSPTVTGCTFSGNSAYNGGGIYNRPSSPTVTGCTFSGNSAYWGGGICNHSSSPTVSNCTFSGNSANRYGAGMFNWDSSSPTVSNCTFSGNSAYEYGGGMFNWDSSSPTMTDCILWGDTATSGGHEIYNYDATCTPVISYCDIAGCLSGGSWDTSLGSDAGGNIDEDPCFADPGNWEDPCNTPGDANDDVWVDGDYHLKSEGGRWDPNTETWVLDEVTSPCIDAGDWASPVVDEPYPNGGKVNMGAYGSTAQAGKSPAITCWEALECAGQRFGDALCDGNIGTVNLGDLYALKAHFGQSAPWTGDQCCADFDHDGFVNLADLFILKANFDSGPYSPSTGNQACPP